MESSKLVATVCVVLSLCGCAPKPDKDQQVLSSFENYLPKFEKEISQQPRDVRLIELGNDQWYKRYDEPDFGTAKFNVERTQSLVSPYVATVTYNRNHYETEGHRRKKDAEEDANFHQTEPEEMTTHCAYQNEQWVCRAPE